MGPKPLSEIPYDTLALLRLHVYAVGYDKQGESILVVVAEGEKALYTIVTDCYEGDENYNHVMHILKEDWGAAPVNIFVWTHPHEDHSVGIAHLLDTHDNKAAAHVFGPVNVVDASGCHEIKSVATDAYNYLQGKYNRGRRNGYHFVGYDPFAGEEIFRVKFNGRDEESAPFYMELAILAPHRCLAGRFMDSPATRDLNEVSVAYMLTVCGLSLLMSGDMPNASIRKIDNGWWKHVDYVKLPHHASKGANLLAKKLVMNTQPSPEGVTTVYRTNGNDLPHMPTVGEYRKQLANVYCTGPEPANASPARYGCVHSIYNLETASLEKVDLHANAYKF